MNTYLSVPYSEKDDAKKLGARWDADQKKWYVKDSKNLVPFTKWMPGFKKYINTVEPIVSNDSIKSFAEWEKIFEEEKLLEKKKQKKETQKKRKEKRKSKKSKQESCTPTIIYQQPLSKPKKDNSMTAFNTKSFTTIGVDYIEPLNDDYLLKEYFI